MRLHFDELPIPEYHTALLRNLRVKNKVCFVIIFCVDTAECFIAQLWLVSEDGIPLRMFYFLRRCRACKRCGKVIMQASVTVFFIFIVINCAEFQ